MDGRAGNGGTEPRDVPDASRGLSALAFAALAAAATAIVLASGVRGADRAEAELTPVLGALANTVGVVSASGGWLIEAGGTMLRLARLPALAALLGWLALDVRRDRRGGSGRMLAALGIGWLAQSFLLDGQAVAGVSLMAAALAAYVSAAPALSGRREGLHPASEVGAFTLAIALYAIVSLQGLDLYPPAHVDEAAYLQAARMRIGEIEPGPIFSIGLLPLYQFEQFRSQAVPLSLHAAAVEALTPGIVALRIGSAVTLAVALWAAAVALRRRLGARVALLSIALCSAAPLWLAFGRTGFYIAATMLHGVLCFWLLLVVWERWRVGWAALLGVLLGASLYFYQLSWFVPLLAALAALLHPAAWRRPGSLRLASVVLLTAVATTLPAAIGMREGLREVTARTWFKAPAAASSSGGFALVIAPDGELPQSVAALSNRATELGLSVDTSEPARGQPAILLRGRTDALDTALTTLTDPGWRVLRQDSGAEPAASRVASILRQLFFAIGWQSNGRWVDAPLLNPVLAPLLLFGLAAAWRGREQASLRLLGVWVVGALILPAAAGGALPRRIALALPFVYVLCALATIEIGGALAARSRATRRAVGIVAGALVAVVVATDVHLYFERWNRMVVPRSAGLSLLALSRHLRALPAGEEIVVARHLAAAEALLAARDDVSRAHRANTPGRVRRAACRSTPPFTWVMHDTPAERVLHRGIATDFALREETFGGYRLLRVASPRPGGCAADAPAARRRQR